MSKRRPTTRSLAYASVRFICPRGHHLPSRAWRTDLPTWSSSAPPTAPSYRLTSGLVRVDSPDGGTKLRMECPKCTATGRPVDLQVTWERVRALLDEVHADERRGVADLQIGG